MTAASGAIVGALTSGSRARWLAWASVSLYAVLAGISIALEARFVGRVGFPDLWVALVVLSYAVIGALIVNTHRSHVIGWMFCGAALHFGFSSFAGQYAIQALVVAPGTLPFGQAMAWFGFWTDMRGIAVIALFLPLLFPNGRLPSPRWRPVEYLAAASVILAVVLTMLAPATYADAGYPSIRNPLGLDQYGAIVDTLGVLLQPLLLVLVVVSGIALFDRVRRGGAVERQQIKWFALTGVYTAVVALFQRMFVALSGQGSDLAIVMTLFVLATVFTPIKNTLQERVDRRIKPRSGPISAHATSIDDLLMLSELHDRGVLTDEEFAAKKKQVLGI